MSSLRLAFFTLCCLGALTQLSFGRSVDSGPRYIPRHHWAYDVVHKLEQAGYLTSFPKGHFAGIIAVEEVDFAEATILIFEAWRHCEVEDPAAEDLRLAALTLLAEFSYMLDPVVVEFRPGWQYKGPWDSINPEELKLLLDSGMKRDLMIARNLNDIGAANTSIYSRKSAKDEIPLDNWMYPVLDDLTTRGILEGYPDGFFRGGRVLTRYEFAQAVARLLDLADATDQINGTERTVIAFLALELADQLDELSLKNPS